jgi:glutathione synthase/RimK-type ligase-like ATP-grasp enzyme
MAHDRIAIVYEHPLWFEPLFAELERRGVPYDRLHASELVFDPAARATPYALVVNRMSPSAWTRGQAPAIFHTLQYLAHLDAIGAPVLNGLAAYELELSKARQLALFASLGVRHPRTRVVADPALAPAAAEDLEFPVLVKPNIGGSGAGIASFATPAELAAAELVPGLDGTLLVQEQLPAEGESIVRVEILDGELLYAIRILLAPGSFNLCPADYCDLPGIADGVSGRGLPIERYEPPDEIVEDAKRIVAAGGLDLGGVEYLVNARDGEAYFYDVNSLSNFVANAQDVVGFDPFVDLVDLILERAQSAVAA